MSNRFQALENRLMQLMRLAEVPFNERDRVFRYSPARAAFAAFAAIAVGGALLAIGRLQGSGLAYYLAGLFILTPLFMRRRLLARLRPANWLVRMGDAGLFIQFRSYLNHHFPQEDSTVVLIPYHEIRSARLVREWREVPNDMGKGSSGRFHRWVEIELTGDSAPLAQALTNERVRPIPRVKRWYGSSGHRYNHDPVRLASSTRLRVEWDIVPGADVFLDTMSRRTDVLASVEASQAYADLEKLSRVEQETRLLELAEAGDKMAAIKIARRLYAYDLTEAKAFVEGLIRGKINARGGG